jgi:putative membrane protein
MEKLPLSLTDKLAVDRTRLANERTLLAYFRTFIVFLSSGFAIVKLDMLEEIKWMGFFLMVIAPALFLLGLSRFIYVKRSIRKYYKS